MPHTVQIIVFWVLTPCRCTCCQLTNLHTFIQSICLRSVIILSFHLRLDHTNGLLASGLLIFFYQFLISPMHALETQIIFLSHSTRLIIHSLQTHNMLRTKNLWFVFVNTSLIVTLIQKIITFNLLHKRDI